MADTLKLCKHSNEYGYCFLHEEFCPAAPCDKEELVEYAPVIRGTWQLLRHDKFSDVFQCSECGRKVSLTHGRDVAEHYPYCHCGARMSEGPTL